MKRKTQAKAKDITWLWLGHLIVLPHKICVVRENHLSQSRQDAKIFNLIFPLRLCELCERLRTYAVTGEGAKISHELHELTRKNIKKLVKISVIRGKKFGAA